MLLCFFQNSNIKWSFAEYRLNTPCFSKNEPVSRVRDVWIVREKSEDFHERPCFLVKKDGLRAETDNVKEFYRLDNSSIENWIVR